MLKTQHSKGVKMQPGVQGRAQMAQMMGDMGMMGMMGMEGRPTTLIISKEVFDSQIKGKNGMLTVPDMFGNTADIVAGDGIQNLRELTRNNVVDTSFYKVDWKYSDSRKPMSQGGMVVVEMTE